MCTANGKSGPYRGLLVDELRGRAGMYRNALLVPGAIGRYAAPGYQRYVTTQWASHRPAGFRLSAGDGVGAGGQGMKCPASGGNVALP